MDAKSYRNKRMLPYKILIAADIVFTIISISFIIEISNKESKYYFIYSKYGSIFGLMIALLILSIFASIFVYVLMNDTVKQEISILQSRINSVYDSKDAYAEIVRYFISTKSPSNKYAVKKISDQSSKDDREIDKYLLRATLFEIETKYRGAKNNDWS